MPSIHFQAQRFRLPEPSNWGWQRRLTDPPIAVQSSVHSDAAGHAHDVAGDAGITRRTVQPAQVHRVDNLQAQLRSQAGRRDLITMIADQYLARHKGGILVGLDAVRVGPFHVIGCLTGLLASGRLVRLGITRPDIKYWDEHANQERRYQHPDWQSFSF